MYKMHKGKRLIFVTIPVFPLYISRCIILAVRDTTHKQQRRTTMTYNQREMTLKLTRIEVCDLLLACTAVAQETEAKKWSELHDKLSQMLDKFDEKNGFGTFAQ